MSVSSLAESPEIFDVFVFVLPALDCEVAERGMVHLCSHEGARVCVCVCMCALKSEVRGQPISTLQEARTTTDPEIERNGRKKFPLTAHFLSSVIRR